jgi:hypothetical protein
MGYVAGPTPKIDLSTLDLKIEPPLDNPGRIEFPKELDGIESDLDAKRSELLIAVDEAYTDILSDVYDLSDAEQNIEDLIGQVLPYPDGGFEPYIRSADDLFQAALADLPEGAWTDPAVFDPAHPDGAPSPVTVPAPPPPPPLGRQREPLTPPTPTLEE